MAIKTRQVPELGTVLSGPSDRTVYLFEKDKGGQSACYGACAKVWPPLTTKDKPTAGSGLNAAHLDTTRRRDGSLQVTYHGHPLYYYEDDHKPGQAEGQNVKQFGAEWYVLSPSGEKSEKHGGEHDDTPHHEHSGPDHG